MKVLKIVLACIILASCLSSCFIFKRGHQRRHGEMPSPPPGYRGL